MSQPPSRVSTPSAHGSKALRRAISVMSGHLVHGNDLWGQGVADDDTKREWLAEAREILVRGFCRRLIALIGLSSRRRGWLQRGQMTPPWRGARGQSGRR